MSNIEGEEMSLNLSFVDRVEEKLTSPDREILSPNKRTPKEIPSETVVEDFNGNVPEQDISEKGKEQLETIATEKSTEDIKTELQVTEEKTSQEKNVVETFVDRQESYLPFDLNQGQDLKIDMEGRKNKSAEASFQWYKDHNRRNQIFENKVDVQFSDKNAETERISSQLLDKTKEMYYMDLKKEIDNKSKKVSATEDVKLFHDFKSDRFEMYNALNQTTSSKVDETLPEAIQHYGSLEAGAFMLGTSVTSQDENTIQAVSTQSTEQTIGNKTEKVTSVVDKDKVKSLEDVSSKGKLMDASNKSVDENLIFEEDEENVIIHFSSEFSQDQQDGLVEGVEQKQEVMYQQQEVLTEMGKTIKKEETKQVTAKNELKTSTPENLPPVPKIEIERKFKVTSESRDKLVDLGATLLKERIFTDKYYDNDNYSLTLADAWLRQRNETWELKLGRQLSEKAGLPTQYNEISDEKEITKFLLKHFKMDFSNHNMAVPDLLKKIGLVEFAIFTTTRQSYGLPDCTIDLDLTDFGFQVGEIEVMVIDESHIPSALDTITDIANKLGFQPLQLQKPQI